MTMEEAAVNILDRLMKSPLYLAIAVILAAYLLFVYQYLKKQGFNQVSARAAPEVLVENLPRLTPKGPGPGLHWRRIIEGLIPPDPLPNESSDVKIGKGGAMVEMVETMQQLFTLSRGEPVEPEV